MKPKFIAHDPELLLELLLVDRKTWRLNGFDHNWMLATFIFNPA